MSFLNNNKILMLFISFSILLTTRTALAAGGLFDGIGDGSPSNPYIIEDCLDLDAVRGDLSAHYKVDPLGAATDIDCGPDTSFGGALYNSGQGFDPIGNSPFASFGPPFNGDFNGQGFTISNLNISRFEGFIGDRPGVALFGGIGYGCND